MSSYSQHKRVWHNVQQNSEEWDAMRVGLVTSSKLDVVCANIGKAFGEPAIRYARAKALERVNGKKDERGEYKSNFMEDGRELEPIAAELYQYETFNTVTNGGFTQWGLLGDSPDGLVGIDGCIETKCVIANTHWERIEKSGYDTSYKWQIQGHLWISDRQWCDFVQFCPEFPENKRLYVYRVERDEQMIEVIAARLEEFEMLVQKRIEMLGNK